MQNTIIQRIESFAEYKKLSLRKLSIALDFNYTTLNNYSNGRRSAIDIDLICKLISTFEDISPDWLLLGRGEMIRNQENEISKKTDKTTIELLEYLSKLAIENEDLKRRVKECEDIFENINIAALPKTKYGKE